MHKTKSLHCATLLSHGFQTKRKQKIRKRMHIALVQEGEVKGRVKNALTFPLGPTISTSLLSIVLSS